MCNFLFECAAFFPSIVRKLYCYLCLSLKFDQCNFLFECALSLELSFEFVYCEKAISFECV
jgi:hypothetical protein